MILILTCPEELADAKRRLRPEEIQEILESGEEIVDKPQPSPLLMDMNSLDYLIWIFNHVCTVLIITLLHALHYLHHHLHHHLYHHLHHHLHHLLPQ